MESTLNVCFPYVFFLPCDHGLGFDVSLWENSINQSIMVERIELSVSISSHVYRNIDLVAIIARCAASSHARRQRRWFV